MDLQFCAIDYGQYLRHLVGHLIASTNIQGPSGTYFPVFCLLCTKNLSNSSQASTVVTTTTLQGPTQVVTTQLPAQTIIQTVTSTSILPRVTVTTVSVQPASTVISTRTLPPITITSVSIAPPVTTVLTSTVVSYHARSEGYILMLLFCSDHSISG